VTLIADTGALYALYDADDAHHDPARKVIAAEPGRIVVPVLVLAELDYLLLENLGVEAELSFLESVLAGAFALDSATLEDLPRIQELIAQYRDLELGAVDASVIATAERLEVNRIFTVDQRDFRAVRSASGRPFVLLPGDGR
jgi:predicted nucleic acid-binding protein